MSRFTLLFALLLICGCGPARLTWKVQRPDLQMNPGTRLRYAIKSFVVAYPDNNRQVDVFRVGIDKCSCGMLGNPSRKWVEILYDEYPNVFCETGIPISVTAEWMRDDTDERDGLRKFVWSVGWVTLVPVIPVEWIENAKWTLKMSVDKTMGTPVCVRECDERRRSVLPIGYFCFFTDGNDEPFQTTELVFPHHEEDLRMQMKALGAGVAAELIAMEKDGRIRVGAGAPSPSEDASDDDPAARARILSRERKKNLDSLLKAGVITEEEYKKELGK